VTADPAPRWSGTRTPSPSAGVRHAVEDLASGTVPGRAVQVLRLLLGAAVTLKTLDLVVIWIVPARVSGDVTTLLLAVAAVTAWLVGGAALLTGRCARSAAGLLALAGAVAVTWGGAYANHLVFLTIALAIAALAQLDTPIDGRAPSWPVRLLQVHLCVVYLTTGLHKLNQGFLTGASLLPLAERSALWPSPGPDPVWWAWAAVAVTTVAWELTAPVALWTRWRLPWLVAGPLFHLGMVVFISDGWREASRLTVFGLAVAATYVGFWVRSDVPTTTAGRRTAAGPTGRCDYSN
jgi:hypothetical protein